MEERHLVICGLGYSGAAVARDALEAGWRVTATTRRPAGASPSGLRMVAFDAAGPVLESATHVLVTAPPGEDGCPVMGAHGTAIARSESLSWAGYLSTTGVYGDRGGAWVDETTQVTGTTPRARRRLAAEDGWAAIGLRMAVEIFRVAGIYGPGRSVFDDLRSGRARRVVKPGHAFGRIHVDDIAGAVMAALRQGRTRGVRVLNLADDEPAESAAVLTHAAGLLGVAPPPEIPFAQAEPGMSEMARAFWADNRRVAARLTQSWLGYRWRFPTYREGLAAILAEERGERAHQQGQVARA